MITVFTSCYNQSEFLREAIDSVLGQTHKEFEYILYDDGSTDATQQIMREYKDPRIRAFYEPKAANVGIVINRIIALAKGSVFVWCPADDRLLPTLLDRKICKSLKHPRNTVLYSDWNVIDNRGNRLKTISPKRRSPEEFAKCVWTESPIGFTGIWIPRIAWQQAGNFPENLQYSEDYYWMVQAVIHGVPFAGIPEVLYDKRKHSNRLTGRFKKKILQDLPKIRQRLREYQDSL